MASLYGWKTVFRLDPQGEPYKVVDVSKLQGGKVVVIAPHPDDEVFGCGGTIAQLEPYVGEITIIYLTNGIHGTPTGRANSRLKKIRAEEAEVGLKKLGGRYRTIFYPNDDSSNFANRANAKRLLRDLLEIKPDRIFLPWFGDDNIDHLHAGKLFFRISDQLPDETKVWQYEVWAPLIANCFVPIDSTLNRKKQAIKAHQSQLKSRDYVEGVIGLNQYRAIQADLPGAAEAFLVLNLPVFQDMFRYYQPYR